QAHSMTAAARYDHLRHPEPHSDIPPAAAAVGHANQPERRRESLIAFRGPRCRPSPEVSQ
ncbi:MAG TPA: hypothetical protein VGE94_08615, partial [Chloroflexota bacterium]